MKATRFTLLSWSAAWAVLAALLPTSLAADSVKTPPVGSGDLVALTAVPAKVMLRGADRTQQVIITGEYANGGVRDLTGTASYRPGDDKIVRVEQKGLLTPQANGVTDVAVEWQGKTARIEVQVEGLDQEQPINFANEIVPVLTKLGCNTGDCHGKAEGQNGFKLSLLGFDPWADYVALARDGRGRRTFASGPERSLLLLKPTGAMGHGGGKKLQTGAPEYRLLVRWIAAGMPYGKPGDPRVVGISVSPAHRLLVAGAEQQLAVTAHYSDGASADVTRRAEYRSNEDLVAEVTESAQVQTHHRPGEAAIMVRYLGHVAVFRATIPQSAPLDLYPTPAPRNQIDRHVQARLQELGIPPSPLCTDGEFIRRASLDITGALPSPAEVEQFLADPDPEKRAKLVDALLARPASAAYFALKWADILRVQGGSRTVPKPTDKPNPLDTPAQRADTFHAWIRQSLADNKPYDQFVREILTVQGATSGPEAPPPILWYLELKTPQGLVDDTAQAFLGTRIQCAQCHHHPFEKWSQDDYWGLAAFFGRVQWEQLDKDGKRSPVRLSEAGRLGQLVGFDPNGKLTNPQGKVYAEPRALDAAALKIPGDEDPRQKLVAWMIRPDNPFFARALVNRYWAHFLGRGIVEPIDDLRVTNPPSNPALLDALAKDFIDHRFDLKRLVRTICTSTTYQLSSQANEHNRNDKQNFARMLPRRLPAEVLHDAVDQVTGSPSEFVASGGYKFPTGTRAIDLPDAFVSSYFLSVFGKPKRESACECEREPGVTLAQRVHLLNAGAIRTKLANRAKQLVDDPRPDAEKINDAYLAFFARKPTEQELQTVRKYLDERSRSAQAYQDFLWALLNAKEFCFNH